MVALSPDGHLAASATASWNVRVWKTGESRPLLELGAKDGKVTALAFSPDGSMLATGHGDGAVRLWDTTSGDALRELAGHEPGWPIHGLAFAADGKLLATGGDHSQAFVWTVDDGERAKQLTWPAYMIHDEPCPPNKRCYAPELVRHRVIAVALTPGRLHTFGADGGYERAALAGSSAEHKARHRGVFRAASFSGAASHISTIDSGGALRVYTVGVPAPRLEVVPTNDDTGDLIGDPPDVTATRAVAFVAGDTAVAAAGADGPIRVWGIEDGTVATRLTVDGEALPLALGSTADGRRLLAAYDDGSAVLWDLGDGAP